MGKTVVILITIWIYQSCIFKSLICLPAVTLKLLRALRQTGHNRGVKWQNSPDKIISPGPAWPGPAIQGSPPGIRWGGKRLVLALALYCIKLYCILPWVQVLNCIVKHLEYRYWSILYSTLSSGIYLYCTAPWLQVFILLSCTLSTGIEIYCKAPWVQALNYIVH